jgi:plasmid stabilization system protein ParE
MAARRLHYARKASRDLEAITDYIQDQAGELTAIRLLDAVDRTIDLLQTTPHLGVACNLASGRYSRMRQIPIYGPFDRWTMFYTPSATELRIHRIIHSSRNWTRLFK